MPTAEPQPVPILLADDDEDDRQLALEALREARVPHDLRWVGDGEELLAYLRREGRYAQAPTPGVVLLDLNMPRKDGREALAEIKGDPALRRIPVVVLTTSGSEADIRSSYELGANSFITKPTSFSSLVRVVGDFARYWLEVVELPAAARP